MSEWSGHVGKEKRCLLVGVFAITVIFILIGSYIFSYIQPPDEVLLSCDTLGVEGYCIDVEFKTTIDQEGKDISEFPFPHYLRQEDFLLIDKITIIKKPPMIDKSEHQIKDATLKIIIQPTGGHLEEIHPSNYGGFDSKIEREIDIGDKYIIKRMENGDYQHLLNGKAVSTDRFQRINLYRTGEWYIKFNIEGGNTGGWTTLFNGKWDSDVFYVYPRHEIENTRTSDKSMVVAIISLLVIVYIFVIDYYTKWIWRHFDKKGDMTNNAIGILDRIKENLMKLNSDKGPRKKVGKE